MNTKELQTGDRHDETWVKHVLISGVVDELEQVRKNLMTGLAPATAIKTQRL